MKPEIGWDVLAAFGGTGSASETRIFPLHHHKLAPLHHTQTNHYSPSPAAMRKTQHQSLSPRRASVISMVQDFKDILNTTTKLQKLVINPEKCKRLFYWDMCLIACMTHTALVSPYEVSFIGTNVSPFVGSLLLMTRCIVDIFFWLDLILNFFLVYRLSRDKGEMLVRNQGMISSHYLRGWFLYDLISVFPFEPLARLHMNISSTEILRLRRVKLLDLLVLLRMVRFGRIADRWKADININHQAFTVMQLSLKMCVWVHWMACAWGLLAVHQGAFAPTWATVWLKDQVGQYASPNV
jgi:hypothetical protein